VIETSIPCRRSCWHYSIASAKRPIRLLPCAIAFSLASMPPWGLGQAAGLRRRRNPGQRRATRPHPPRPAESSLASLQAASQPVPQRSSSDPPRGPVSTRLCNVHRSGSSSSRGSSHCSRRRIRRCPPRCRPYPFRPLSRCAPRRRSQNHHARVGNRKHTRLRSTRTFSRLLQEPRAPPTSLPRLRPTPRVHHIRRIAR
jgi:hypothetical protein